VIAHVVLFRPRATLTGDERRTLVTAMQHAFDGIPTIRRVRVGRRLTIGRLYDQQNVQDFPFVAILEFDNEADLRAYLDHPAHQSLGEQFYRTSEAALAFDFEFVEGDLARALLA
jgi:hypothetical protein